MMKKAIKKLLAALLAVAMLCAMAVPALAADDATGTATTTGEGEITIDNVVTGHTYKLTAFWIWNITQIPSLTVIRRIKLGEPSLHPETMT